MQKKVSNINLRIISKHLQTMTKAPVKFKKDRHKTVGEGNGTTEPRKAKYHVPSLFFEKVGDNKTIKIKKKNLVAAFFFFFFFFFFFG